jgi:hypothetical protein
MGVRVTLIMTVSDMHAAWLPDQAPSLNTVMAAVVESAMGRVASGALMDSGIGAAPATVEDALQASSFGAVRKVGIVFLPGPNLHALQASSFGAVRKVGISAWPHSAAVAREMCLTEEQMRRMKLRPFCCVHGARDARSWAGEVHHGQARCIWMTWMLGMRCVAQSKRSAKPYKEEQARVWGSGRGCLEGPLLAAGAQQPSAQVLGTLLSCLPKCMHVCCCSWHTAASHKTRVATSHAPAARCC